MDSGHLDRHSCAVSFSYGHGVQVGRAAGVPPMNVVDCCVVSPHRTRNNYLWLSNHALGSGQGPDLPGYAGQACWQYGPEQAWPWRWGFELPGGTTKVVTVWQPKWGLGVPRGVGHSVW